MSSLPNNTFASPGNPFYALIDTGGGGPVGPASSLQSPATIIPDAALGDAILNINSAGGASFAALSVIGGLTADGDIGLGGGGSTYDFKASGTTGNLTMAVIPLQVNQQPFLNYSPQAGTLLLGDGLLGGSVLTNQPLQVQGNPANGNAVQIQSTSGTAGSIKNTAAAGGSLVLGSSTAAPSVVNITDTGAAITGTLSSTGLATISDLIVTGTGLFNGSLTADDITLTGASSVIQVPGQGGAGQPPVGITMSLTQTLIGNPELRGSLAGAYNGGIVGQASFNFVINSTGQPAGVIGNTGAQVGGPAVLGDIACEGLWIVSLVVSNASTDIYSKLAQIRTVSYWNPITGWFGGSGGYSSAGGAEFRAGINPSNVIAPGQLWVTNSSGNNWTGMSVNLTQITGVIPGYFVA